VTEPRSVALVPSDPRLGGAPPLDRERYTVLLLDEDQLERFLARPRMRDVAPVPVRAVPAWPRPPRLTVRRAAVTMAVLAAAATLWIRTSGDDLEAPIAAAAPVVTKAPPVPTGAGLSVRLMRFAGDTETRAVASRLAKTGLPAFAWQVEGPLPDLLVGPFVSIDEAERAQATLAAQGYRRSRLHVDDRLRSARMAPAAATPAVLAVAAPGRESLVFELAAEPRAVSGERVDLRTFEVFTSPAGAIDAQEWNMPGDVRLIQHVALEADPRGERGLTARVRLSAGVRAGVRVEGSRVYVDVQEEAQEIVSNEPRLPAQTARPVEAPVRFAVPASPAVAEPAPAAVARPQLQPKSLQASPADVMRYRESVAPVFARFEEIQPFLRSAVGQGSPDVLAALAGTFAELEQTLGGLPVPPGAQDVHNLLSSAVQLAKGATSLGSTADRAVQVREATAQFQAARARLK
jgi:hypothetical protein